MLSGYFDHKRILYGHRQHGAQSARARMKYPVLRTRARRRSPSRCRAPHILALATLASTLGVISVVLHWPRGLVSELAVAPDLSSPPPPSPSLSTSLTPRRPPLHVDTPGAYVLVSFKNGEVLGDGLRLLVSRDARRWHALPNEPLVLPLEQTGGKVFRDPSILWWQGAFHLVWSSDLCVGQVPGKWQCKGLKGKKRPAPRFGYASSTDLVNWRDVQLVELKLRDACSLWAPELSELPADEGGGVMLSFSATVVKGECPANFKRTRHRAMFVTSMDMRRWSKPLPLLEAEAESVIDLFPLLAAQPREAPDGGDDPARRHVLLYKTEYNGCDARRWTAGVLPRSANGSCTLVLRQATARTARGPWTPDKRASGGFFPGAISRPCVEGATALRLGPRRYAALFDAYRTDCAPVPPHPQPQPQPHPHPHLHPQPHPNPHRIPSQW